MKLKEKNMTIDDNVIVDPTDEELAEIEDSLDDMFSISEDEYEESFGGMVTLDKGLFGAKHRETLASVRKHYSNAPKKS